MKIASCDDDADAEGARASTATTTPAAARRARRTALSARSLLDAQPLVDLEEELLARLGMRVEVEHAQDRLGRLLGLVDGAELEARQPQPGVRVAREAKDRALERRLGVGVAVRRGLHRGLDEQRLRRERVGVLGVGRLDGGV